MEKKKIDWEERKYELTKTFAKTLLQRADEDNNTFSYSYGTCQDIVDTAIFLANRIIDNLK